MTSEWFTPWLSESVARAQRALTDQQVGQLSDSWPTHFTSLVDAVKAIQCPGKIVEWGCGSGVNLEVLRAGGVEFNGYTGIDISPEALWIAAERHPEVDWTLPFSDPSGLNEADIVIDGSCVLHVEDWRAHLAQLCKDSRRWVILHRIPITKDKTAKCDTKGYGQTFPAWVFNERDVMEEMGRHGFELVEAREASDVSNTLTFAKARHFASYCDNAYLPRLKVLYASLKRHCPSFRLHVLAWDREVFQWCEGAESVYGVGAPMFLNTHYDYRINQLPGPERSKVEHYWTCGPRWIADVMEKTGEAVTYIDADCALMSSPERMFAEIGEAPAAFPGHNFPLASQGLPGPNIESHMNVGLFNVGVLYFSSQFVIERWAKLCHSWCYAKIEAIEPLISPVMIADRRLRYGDQHFLEDLAREFPGIALLTDGRPLYQELFPAAKVIDDPACMLGPWNAHSQQLEMRDGVVHFAGRPLISYHFSALQLGPHGQWSPSRPEYQLTERQIEVIYRPYVEALAEVGR